MLTDMFRAYRIMKLSFPMALSISVCTISTRAFFVVGSAAAPIRLLTISGMTSMAVSRSSMVSSAP